MKLTENRVKPAERYHASQNAIQRTESKVKRRFYHNLCSMKLLFILLTAVLLIALFLATFLIYYFVQKQAVDQLSFQISRKTFMQINTFTMDFLKSSSAMTAQAAQPYFDSQVDLLDFEKTRVYNWLQMKKLAEYGVNQFRLVYYDWRYKTAAGLPRVAEAGYWYIPGKEAGTYVGWAPTHPYNVTATGSKVTPFALYWADADIETGEIYKDSLIRSSDYLPTTYLPYANRTRRFTEIAVPIYSANEDGSDLLLCIDIVQFIAKNDVLLGAVALTRSSIEIQEQFKHVEVSKTGQMFLSFTYDLSIIATSNAVELYNKTDNTVLPPNETADPRINACVNFILDEKKMNRTITPGMTYFIQTHNETLLVYIDYIYYARLNFTAFVIIPWDDIAGEINKSYVVGVVVSIGILVAALVLALISTIIATRPLTLLSRDMAKVAKMQLNIKMKSLSCFSEMNHIQYSFFQMINNLTEFRSFLPEFILERFEEKNEDAYITLEEEEVNNEPGKDQKQSPQPGASNTGRTSPAPTPSTGSRSEDTKSRATSKHTRRKTLFSSTMFDTMQLGLHTKHITVLHIKLEHFEEATKRLLAAEVMLLHSAISSVVDSIVKDAKGTLVYNSTSYTASWNSSRPMKQHAMMACKAAHSIVMQAQQTLKEVGNNEKIVVSVGIASGNALVGNVGTKESRRFEIIGAPVQQAENLATLAIALNRPKASLYHAASSYADMKGPGVEVITHNPLLNHECFKDINQHFVICPVDIIQFVEKDDPVAIYELHEPTDTKSEEWMYELENQKNAARYDIFKQGFDMMRRKHYPEAAAKLQDFMDYYTDTKQSGVASKLLELDPSRISKLLLACKEVSARSTTPVQPYFQTFKASLQPPENYVTPGPEA